MPLLSEAELLWSPVVANTRMNRGRQASGVNSYAKELHLDPAAFLAEVVGRHGAASWLDLCCGEGRAVLQAAAQLRPTGLAAAVRLVGLDLVDAFAPVPPDLANVTLATGSVLDWPFAQSFDLITCSHGLHYLGDKLAAITRAVAALRPGGVFVANFTAADVVIAGADALRLLPRWFAAQGLHYDARRRLIRRVGPARLRWPLTYTGADDTTGPNYTGQAVVTSHYALLPGADLP